MTQYFVKRAENDFADMQRVAAEDGHALKVRKFLVASLRQNKRYTCPLFVDALKILLKELGKRGYTEKSDGLIAPGGRFVKFEDLSRDQLLGKFASIQQAVAKWVWKATETNDDLWMRIVEDDLVFCANDASAVMQLLFELFDYNGYLAYDAKEHGFDAFQQRLLACISK